MPAIEANANRAKIKKNAKTSHRSSWISSRNIHCVLIGSSYAPVRFWLSTEKRCGRLDEKRRLLTKNSYLPLKGNQV
jgi:hypothetical protein